MAEYTIEIGLDPFLFVRPVIIGLVSIALLKKTFVYHNIQITANTKNQNDSNNRNKTYHKTDGKIKQNRHTKQKKNNHNHGT